MFDRVSEAAEKLATNVSRRAFLGRLGRGAAVLAGVMGGLCAAPRLAQARPPIRGSVVCCSSTQGGYTPTGGCSPPMRKNCVIVSADCTGCVWNCGGVLMSSPCNLF
jgi:hypothetical protein